MEAGNALAFSCLRRAFLSSLLGVLVITGHPLHALFKARASK